MRVLLAVLGAVVPWIPAVPPATPSHPPTSACRAGNLRVGLISEQGATGWLVAGIQLRNVGPTCSVTGRPTIEVAAPQQVHETPLSDQPLLESDALPPRFPLDAVPRGSAVGFTFWWTNACFAGDATLTVDLPHGGGSLALPRSADGKPRCDLPSSPIEVQVSRFLQSLPPPKPATKLPFAVGFPRLNYTASAGGVLAYQVTLRNVSRRPFTFRNCPAYQESLVLRRIVRETHILNCAPARTFAPGEARSFAMRLRIPRGAGGQHSPIFFELGLGTYDPPNVPPARNAAVTIS